MATRIKLRSDTAANWAAANPILAAGEIGLVVEGDLRRAKVGDGATAWNALDWAFEAGGGGGGASTFAELTDKATADLPAINGPLATALSGKAPASGIAPSAIAGTAVITTDPRLSDARTPTSHTHPATAIADSTETGRSLLTAANQAAARSSGLGSGATGDELFQALSVKAANETLLRTTKIKTTQTDRNSTTTGTTYTTDSDFTIPVTAGKTYRVEFALYTTATSASGFKGQFVIPSVPSMITGNANGVGVTTNPGAGVVGLRLTPSGIIGDTTLSRGTSATNGTYHGFFEITIGATGGDLLFQWAQTSSSVDNTSVLANSAVTVIERTP